MAATLELRKQLGPDVESNRSGEAQELLTEVDRANMHSFLGVGTQGVSRSRRTNIAVFVLSLTLMFVGGHWMQSRFNEPRQEATDRQELGVIDEYKTAPCAGLGENCTASRCCTTLGHQCFKKDSIWSTCRPFCVAAPDPMDQDSAPWDCTARGPVSPGRAPPPDYTQQQAAWTWHKCSETGSNCNTTLCCRDAGTTCFQKNDGWSACKPECTAGPDPTDSGDSKPWNCTAKGFRTPGVSANFDVPAKWVKDKCAASGENCLHSGCCQDAGHQCFMKIDDWATCKSKCVPGPDLTDANPDPWNCTALGGRTPGTAKASPRKVVADWVATNCSQNGDNCSDTTCCAEPTMQCYRKNHHWASCQRGCKVGVHDDDKDGGKWSCEELGPRTPRKWGSPALYCVSVIRVNGYEAAILQMQASTHGGIGIFGCDEYDVFASDGRGWVGDGPDGPVWTHHFDPAPVTVSVDGTAGNTALFMNFWEAVKWIGRWSFTDWTIKIDPDAVIFPDRLRYHLKPHTGQAVYVKNCNSYTLVQQGPMMFGSVEALSQQAMNKYYNGGGEYVCKKNYQYGEDRWFGECFNELGVGSVGDFGMVGDKLCIGSSGNGDCSDGRAAYHFYKDSQAWLGCYNTAMR